MSFQSQLSEASPKEVAALKSDPRKYIASCWRHPNDQGRRYDFQTTDGETKLHYMLDDDGPLNPRSWGGVNILLMARGLLKTTTLQAITNWALQFFGPEGFEGYMAAPRDDQTTEFVGKLKEKLSWSGVDQYREKNALSHQKFKYELDGRTSYAHFKADSGWGAGDAMRGPHSHLGIYDEFQDATAKSFNAGFYEVIDQSIAGVPYFPTMFLMGTPKMEGSFYEEMWERSDQREWHPDEGEHGAWVTTDDPSVYGEGDDTMEVHGWRIDQQRAPLHSDAQIAAKRDMKSEQEFANEVMAQFYSPEDHLLSERHVDAIVDPTEGFVTSPRQSENWVTLGVDWGGGSDRKAADTVVVVQEHIQYDDGTSETVVDQLDFLDETLSKNEEFEHLEKRIIQFDPDRVVVDEGYGAKRREDLQKGNGTMDDDGYDRVVGCRFGNITTTDKVKWKDSEAQKLFTADKSHVGKAFVDYVKAERMVIPSSQIDTGAHGRDEAVGTKLYRQLTAPFEEKRETKSGRKKSSITSKSHDNDDAFDAMIYAWIAYHMGALGPTNTPRRFSSHAAPGT